MNILPNYPVFGIPRRRTNGAPMSGTDSSTT
jgi:hypothetical protein